MQQYFFFILASLTFAQGRTPICTSGQFLAVGSRECQYCPAGQFNEFNGDVQMCDICPAGTFSAEGASKCKTCSDGHISGKGAASCTPCQAGTSNDLNHVKCVACLRGHSSSSGESCAPCQPGFATHHDASLSTFTYPDASSPICKPCPGGYSSAPRSVACTPCPSGTFSTAGTLCQPCDYGFVSSAGSAQCVPCPAGKSCNTRVLSEAMPCPSGTFSAESQADCIDCPIGHYSSKQASECTPCMEGYTSQAGSRTVAACRRCQAGFISSNATQFACVKCPLGYRSNEGSSTCSPCEEGSQSVDNACTLCQPNTYSSGKTNYVCVKCPLYTVSSSGSRECSSCKPTERYDSATSSCQPCPLNQHGDLLHPTVCFACPKDRHLSKAGKCVYCSQGFDFDYTRDECMQCPNDQYSVPGSNCKTCPKGSSFNRLSKRCVTCQPGQQATTDGCQDCQAGTFSTDGDKCIPCSYGEVSTLKSSRCSKCPEGTYYSENSCIACPMGKSSIEGSTSQLDCTSCAPGTYSSQSKCLPCTPGTYSSTPEAEKCENCPEGFISDEKATNADQCVDKLKCQSLLAAYSEEAKFVNTNEIVDEQFKELRCSQVKRYNQTFTDIQSLQLGTYPLCPQGTYSPSGISRQGIRCHPCRPGFFAPGTGSKMCKRCPEGTYSDSLESKECKPCKAPEYLSLARDSCEQKASLVEYKAAKSTSTFKLPHHAIGAAVLGGLILNLPKTPSLPKTKEDVKAPYRDALYFGVIAFCVIACVAIVATAIFMHSR